MDRSGAPSASSRLAHALRSLGVAALALWATQAGAAMHRFDFGIDGAQVRNGTEPDGSTSSPATGFGHLVVDDVAMTLAYTITWSGLLGDLTALHVHGPAGPEQNNMLHLLNVFFDTGDVAAAGVDPRTDEYTQVVAVSAAQLGDACDAGGLVACLMEERAYINVHSEVWPMGEIRGQVRRTPRLLVWTAPADEQQVGNSGIGDGSTDSPGTGQTHLRYDLQTETFDYRATWRDLQLNPTQLHVHGPALPGASTPNHLLEVFNTLAEVIDPPPADPAAFQAIEGAITVAGSATQTACANDAPVPCLLEGRAYTNLHTQAFLMGEIRGQMLTEPHPYRFTARIDEQQVGNSGVGDGSTDSPALGSADYVYDAHTETLAYTIRWSSLLGLLTKLHVHGPAMAGESTPLHLIEYWNSEAEVIAAGVGRITGEYTAADPLAIGLGFGPCAVAAPLACLIEGRGYLNVHTEVWPMGEIRGQILLVPEPSAGLAAATVLGVLAWLRARRRAARATTAAAPSRAAPGSGAFRSQV